MSFLEDTEAEARRLLAAASAATDEFQARSGIRCREGCGQCCLKPGIEARPAELLPLARMLLARGDADAVYEKAQAQPDGGCVFYRPSAADPTLGRCGEYALRPSLCRLFGFTAVSRKEGRPALAACHWHKKLQPEVVAAAQRAIDAGEPVPTFREFSLQLDTLAPGTGLAQLLPINRALMAAIEKASLAYPSEEAAQP